MQRCADNQPTGPLTPSEIADFVRWRNSYNYPKAFMTLVDDGRRGPNDVQISNGVWARCQGPGPTGGVHIDQQDNNLCAPPKMGSITDLDLDNYHYCLLRSERSIERLLGLASVVYWGYFNAGHAAGRHAYAINRVRWLINGYRGQLATTVTIARRVTDRIIDFLDRNNFAGAIGSMAGISQLNQTPFASKVVALMAPSVAGVYDNRIMNGLKELDWATHMQGGIGNVRSRKVQVAYHSWCSYLTWIAVNLNCKASKWRATETSDQGWRAIDVERALFYSFRTAAIRTRV